MTQPSRILCLAAFVMALMFSLAQRAAAQLVYTTVPRTNSVVVIDSATNSVVNTIAIAPSTATGPGTRPGSIALSPDAKFAYVVNEGCDASPGDGTVSVIDTGTSTVTANIPVGGCPREIALTPDGLHGYVTTFLPATGLGAVVVTDLSTNSVSSTVNLTSNDFPTGIAVTPAGDLVWAGKSDGLYAIATSTNTVAGNLVIQDPEFAGTQFASTCGIGDLALTPDGNFLLGDCEANEAVLVDLHTGRVVFNALVSCTIGAPAITPDGTRAFVSDAECGGILDIAMATGVANLFFLSGNSEPTSLKIAFTSDGKKAFASGFYNCCAQAGKGDVQVFDPSNDSSIADIPVAAVSAAGIAVMPNNNTFPPPNQAPVMPLDRLTNTSPATLTFTTVSQPGYTSLFINSSGPAVPTGFALGSPAVYYDLATTAQFTGNITICITSPEVSSTSQLFHFGISGPVDITTSVNPPTICGTTASLSPFAILQPTSSGATATSTSISLTPAASISYGAVATAMVTVSPTSGIVTGNVTLSVDGGAASSMALSGGSATFNLGVLNTGSHSLSANFAAQEGFVASAANATLVVTPAASMTGLATSPNPSTFGLAITLTAKVSPVAPGAGTPTGTPTSSPPTGVTLYDGTTVLGTAGLNSAATATFSTSSLGAGSHSLTASYSGDTNFTGSTTTTVTMVVNQATPAITWAAPAAITYGTALGTTQLNAATTVAGSFAYTPPAGTVLSAGTQTLSVSFTPADVVDYATATAQVSLTVNKATPVISWAAPAPILVGTPLTNAQLDATASVLGSFSYSAATGASLPAGIQTLSTIFMPADAVDYTTATASVLLAVDQPPTMLSPASATLTELNAGSFTFQSSGFPPAALTESGNLPTGLIFMDSGNGTATLSGTPAAGTAGTYPITIMGANGIGANTAQSFTLTVAPALQIYSGNSTGFTEGTQGWFLLATTGTPLPALTETGNLPAGVTFKDNGDGTATLNGTPGPGTAATYPIAIKASNSVGAMAMQSFTLTVNSGGPAIVTGNVTTFTEADQGTFTTESFGFPVAALTATGSLPAGVTFTDNGDGTGTLSGTPGPGTKGTYPITVSASNAGGSTAAQILTLLVNQGVAITSTNTAAFVDQAASAFTITALGKPTPALSGIGPLPNGVTFVDNGNGSATLAGTPAAGSVGLYGFTVRASNGAGSDAIQTFLLAIKGTTAVSASSLTSVALAGQQVTLTASLNATSSGQGVPAPTGTITFFDASATLGTVALTSSSCGAPNPNIQCSVSFSTSALAAGSHSITAQYSSDAYYQGSASPQPFLITMNQSLTAVSVVPPTPTTALAGQQITLVANISVISSGPGVPAPTEMITFLDGSAALGTVALTSSSCGAPNPNFQCTASFPTSALAAGSHLITVQYSGDANYLGSTSPPPGFGVTINTIDTFVSASVSPSFVSVGQTFNISVQIFTHAASPLPPCNGNLLIQVGGQPVPGGPIPVQSQDFTGSRNGASATYNVSFTPGVPNNSAATPITVTFQHCPLFSDIQPSPPQATLLEQIESVSTTTTLTVSPGALPNQVAFTAKVNFQSSLGAVGGASFNANPGIVEFDIEHNGKLADVVPVLDPSTTFATATLGPGITDPNVLALLTPGPHFITALYTCAAAQCPLFSSNQPSVATVTVFNTTTGNMVTVSPQDSGTGTSPVSLTFANVRQVGLTTLTISTSGPATPSGFAVGMPPTYFYLGTGALFTPPITVCINYAGISFPNNIPALFHYQNGAWVNVTTSVDTTKMIICGNVSSLSPFALFAPLPVLTITANSFSRQYGGADAAFTVSYNGFVNGDTPASLSGTLTCLSTDTAASPVGTYAIDCSGLSSPNYVIRYASGVLTVTSTPLTVTAGSAQRVYGATNPVFTGMITGIQNGDNISATYATAATPASPVGTYAFAPTLVDPTGKLGNYKVTLINGTLTVIQASTTTTLSVSPNPSNFGQSITLTATVGPVAPGVGTAKGTVTFLDGSLTLGTGTLSGADIATSTTSSLAAGSHSFTASYGGDANFRASSSSALADQVLCGVLISLSSSTVPLGGTVTVTGKVISCSTTTQPVVVQFSLSGPAQPNSCSSTKSVMFTTPPFSLAPKTSQTVSFPFKVPSGVCPGTYSITATTHANSATGAVLNISTASLTITVH